MNSLYKNHSINRIVLFLVALTGLALVAFYLVEIVHEPEYLIYYSPIFGLAFYGSYYIINHKMDRNFLNQAYSDTHADA